MQNELKFVDNTILSTPAPVHSSSMTSDSTKKRNVMFADIDDIPERLNDTNNSLGLLSIASDDIFLNYRLSDAGQQRQKEREKALSLLKDYDKSRMELTSIPSRFLRRSDVSENTEQHVSLSESTISEADLLPGNCSTPRHSLMNEEFVMRDRQSMGQSVSQLASSITDPSFQLNNLMKEFQKSVDFNNDSCFQSGADAIAKLEEDEKVWREQQVISASPKEFSVTSIDELKVSMGSFFIKKSDDLPKLFAKSPPKSQNPIPLIETTIANEDITRDSTIGLSDIQHILASDQSTTNALDKLLKPRKIKKSLSPNKKSPTCEKIRDSEKYVEILKENVSPEVPSQKSILSSRSSSSLSSLPNGKLPIATTKTEIIWGCLKIGKTSSQEFVIRNRSASRLSIQCSVTNAAFRLNKDGSDSNFSSMLKIILHPYESRCLTVTFSPNDLGAAVGFLSFNSADPTHQQTVKQFIKLYGYGGFGNIHFHKMIKDTSGKYLMSLGNIDETQNLRRTFMSRNVGTLAAFVYFYFSTNGLQCSSNVEVSPQSAVLLPGEEREVTVSYLLSKRDFAYMKSKINTCVIDVGKLQSFHGTEVDRARLRKVAQKAKEKNVEVHPFIFNLVAKLPGEVIPSDVKHFKESAASIDDVLKLLTKEEITVTVEQDVDLSTVGPYEEETEMFQSLCENTALETFEYTVSKEGCQVDPTRIILTPPEKIKDRIFLINNTKKTQYFEVSCVPEGLAVNPKDGTVKSGETLIIDVMCAKKCNDKAVFKIKVLVDNECFEVTVKIIFVRQ